MSKEQGNVPISEIFMDNRFNCRGFFSPHTVIELQKSIKEMGLQQPVGLRRFTEEEVEVHDGKKYKLIMGYRRLTAYRQLAAEDATNGIIPSPYDEIPAMIEMEEMSEADERILNLAENVQREGLSFLQQVDAVQAIADCGLSRNAIAEQIGSSPAWVQQRLVLNKLPDYVRDEVSAEMIKQSELGVLYTVYNRRGEDALQKTLEKFRGKRTVNKNAQVKINMNKKKVRSGAEIQDLQYRMQNITEDDAHVTALVLGWAGGNIDDIEFEQRLEAYCTEKGYIYQKPVFDV